MRKEVAEEMIGAMTSIVIANILAEALMPMVIASIDEDADADEEIDLANEEYRDEE